MVRSVPTRMTGCLFFARECFTQEGVFCLTNISRLAILFCVDRRAGAVHGCRGNRRTLFGISGLPGQTLPVACLRLERQDVGIVLRVQTAASYGTWRRR